MGISSPVAGGFKTMTCFYIMIKDDLMACTISVNIEFGKAIFSYSVANLDIVNWDLFVVYGAKTLPSPSYLSVFDYFKILRSMILSD